MCTDVCAEACVCDHTPHMPKHVSHIYIYIKLSPGVVMVAKGDVGNKYNQLALTFKLPNGKIVGRVPANMCKIFST